MDWDSRLPDGVHDKRTVPDGFEIGVSMPTGEDGLLPCRCPDHPEHRFKAVINFTSKPASDTMTCPYCGKQAPVDEFIPADVQARLRDAMTQVARRHVEGTLHKILNDTFGPASGLSRPGSPLRVEYRPGTPRPFRPLQPTRSNRRAAR